MWVGGLKCGQYVLELDTYSCLRRKWDLCGIPCPYAVAAIRKNDLDLINYVHNWYKKEANVKDYEYFIHPISGLDV